MKQNELLLKLRHLNTKLRHDDFKLKTFGLLFYIKIFQRFNP